MEKNLDRVVLTLTNGNTYQDKSQEDMLCFKIKTKINTNATSKYFKLILHQKYIPVLPDLIDDDFGGFEKKGKT